MQFKSALLIGLCLALSTSSTSARKLAGSSTCLKSQSIPLKGSSGPCNQVAALAEAKRACTQKLLQQKMFSPSADHVVDATVSNFHKSPASGATCEYTAVATCCLKLESKKEAGGRNQGNVQVAGNNNNNRQAQGAPHGANGGNKGAGNQGAKGQQGARGQNPNAGKPNPNKPAQPGKQGPPAAAAQRGAGNQKPGAGNRPNQPDNRLRQQGNKPNQPNQLNNKPNHTGNRGNAAPVEPKAVQIGPNTYSFAAAFREPRGNAGPRPSML